jgi:hypothetical protein
MSGCQVITGSARFLHVSSGKERLWQIRPCLFRLVQFMAGCYMRPI